MEQRKNSVYLNTESSWDRLEGRTREQNCSVNEEFGVCIGNPRGRGWKVGVNGIRKRSRTWRKNPPGWQEVEKRQPVRSSRLWPKIFKKHGVMYSVLRCLLQCKFLFLFSYLPLLMSKLLHRGAFHPWYFDKIKTKSCTLPWGWCGMEVKNSQKRPDLREIKNSAEAINNRKTLAPRILEDVGKWDLVSCCTMCWRSG